jgi:uncharacterized protein with HEPN domain
VRRDEQRLQGYSEILWNVIVGMRHILVHEYFGIDLDEVWSVVERDLPALRPQIQEILRDK